MAVELGWQRIITADSNVNPGMKISISALPYIDSCVRNGNTITYTINFALKLDNCSFWDYIWWIDTEVGPNQAYNKLVKPSTAWRQNIVGKMWYMSSYSGHLNGSITVNSTDTRVPIRLRYHDSNNNWTGWFTWYMEIPRATAPSNLRSSTSSITEYSATVTGNVDSFGAYSDSIQNWAIEYHPLSNPSDVGFLTYSGNVLSRGFNLTGLKPYERYSYTIAVANNLGFEVRTSGSFQTLEEKFCYKVTSKFKVGDNPNNTIITTNFPNTISVPYVADWTPLISLSNGNVLFDYQKTSAVIRVRLHEIPSSSDESTMRIVYERNIASQVPTINEKRLLIVNAGAIGAVADNELTDYICGENASGSKVVLVKPYVITDSDRRKIVSIVKK